MSSLGWLAFFLTTPLSYLVRRVCFAVVCVAVGDCQERGEGCDKGAYCKEGTARLSQFELFFHL